MRRVVASRISHNALWRMLADEDALVRLAVAHRLTPVELIGLRDDPDWRVRYEAASRMVPGTLAAMLDDPDELVRDLVRQRIAMQKSPELSGNVVPIDAARKASEDKEKAQK